MSTLLHGRCLQMSKVKQRLQEMLQIQDETNSRLNPYWMWAGYNFLLAAKVEAAEAIDHLGYKWWSDKPADYDQARMECVDMWHFLLSEICCVDEDSGEYEETVEHLERWYLNHDREVSGRDHPWWPFEWFMGEEGVEDAAASFVECCAMVNLTFDELYKLYIGKAALNRFRWANGYGSTYRKVWNGREDNEHLTEILQTLADEFIDINHITKELEARYAMYLD